MLMRRLPTAKPRSSRSQQHGARPRVRLVVLAHGHGHGHPHGHGGASPTGVVEKQEKEKGFINEMRRVAMKLHTKEQAPKEGGKEAPKTGPWTPTLKGYLLFLAESKAVFEALEQAVKNVDHPEYAVFRNTGLERSQALVDDIAWFKQTHGMDAPTLSPEGPGLTYARKVLDLAQKDPQAFICHFYNFYFAHTAGGMMIGKRVSAMLLDGHTLHFYQWNGDVTASLDAVRRNINQLAETWTPEQKKHCLAETEISFQYSGKILQCITQA